MKYLFLAGLLMGISLSISGQGIKINQEVRMLALGDSYTIGERVNPDQRWPHQFVTALRSLGLKAPDPDYIAVTGWTTTDLLNGIRNDLDSSVKYNLVSILIGVNNQYQGLDIEIYAPELRKIIVKALDLVEQDCSRIFMLSIPDYAFTPFGKGDKDISAGIDAYNSINKALALEYGLLRVDITGISRRGLSIPSLVAEDGLHPSGKQYANWVGEILPNLSIDLKPGVH